MKDYTDLLKRLEEAHIEEQEFNKETFGERYFDPEEGTLYKDAHAAIRELTAPKATFVTDEMVDEVLEYNWTPRRHLFEYPHRDDDSRKMIKDAEALVRTILRQAQSSATLEGKA